MSTLTPDQWHSVSPYLDQALAMTDEERALWLARLRLHDPLLAGQVENLLCEHRVLSDQDFLTGRSLASPHITGLAGRSLGPYKLHSQIGEGGTGSVWLAERNDGRFERRVAVKFLNISLVGKLGEERFKREGRILALLLHPHIAELLDAGVSQTGQPYLVLEHVEGQHIDRFCDDRKLDIAARLRLFLDVLGAVARAHANLIVHRDLKPSNVLVRRDGQVKLLDFGIAKLLEGEGENGQATQLTIEGGHALTPAYAAPEQLKDEPVTTATDVYALGVLLYVLLTGQHPAGGPRTPADLVKAVVDTEPTRPSDVVTRSHSTAEVTDANAALRSATPEKLHRLLRGDLDTIVGKALKKDPAERYASVTAMADDIRRFLRNEPISARPDTLTYRAAKFVRRNRAAIALATLAVAATSAGVVGTLVQSRTARHQRDFAFRQLSRAERLNDLNDILLTDVAPSGKALTANQLIQQEERIVEREHNDNPANHVELLVSIGDQYTGEGENTRGLRILQEAYQLSRGLSEPSVRAKASCAMTGGMLSVGKLAEAESYFQEGMRELPAEPQFGSDRVFCLTYGIGVAYDQGNSEEAVARALTAERVVQESPAHSPVEELNVLTQLAGAYAAADRFTEANATFARASARMLSLGYDETQKATKLFNDWGLALSYAGRPLEAEKAYRHAIDISRTDATEKAVLPPLLYNYSIVLRDLGRLPEAADYANRAYVKAQANQNQILVDKIFLQQARICRDQRNFVRAASMFREADLRLHRTLPPGHYAFASLLSEESVMAQMRGDLPSALQLANQAVSLDEASIKSGGQGAPFLPSLLTRRSAVELQLHQTDLAASDASRALALLRIATPPGDFSTKVGRAYLALGRALQAQGKIDEARTAFRAAAEHLRATLGPDHSDTRNAWQLASFPS